MSGSPLKAEIPVRRGEVGFGPKADLTIRRTDPRQSGPKRLLRWSQFGRRSKQNVLALLAAARKRGDCARHGDGHRRPEHADDRVDDDQDRQCEFEGKRERPKNGCERRKTCGAVQPDRCERRHSGQNADEKHLGSAEVAPEERSDEYCGCRKMENVAKPENREPERNEEFAAST